MLVNPAQLQHRRRLATFTCSSAGPSLLLWLDFVFAARALATTPLGEASLAEVLGTMDTVVVHMILAAPWSAVDQRGHRLAAFTGLDHLTLPSRRPVCGDAPRVASTSPGIRVIDEGQRLTAVKRLITLQAHADLRTSSSHGAAERTSRRAEHVPATQGTAARIPTPLTESPFLGRAYARRRLTAAVTRHRFRDRHFITILTPAAGSALPWIQATGATSWRHLPRTRNSGGRPLRHPRAAWFSCD